MKLRCLLIGVLLTVSGPLLAHPLAPALLELTQTSATHYNVLWRLSLIQGSQTAPRPVLPAHCNTSQPPEVRMEQGAAIANHWQIDCGAQGLAGAVIKVAHLETSAINVILRIQPLQGSPIQTLLDASRPSYSLPLNSQPAGSFTRYLVLGVEHLVMGPDHLLFLLGLIMLVRPVRALIITLTAFTAGHSITLCLSALNLINVNAALMEFGIALSLLVVARELLRKRPSFLGRAPALMAFGFGLLHGMGFAGALLQIGLPQTEVVSALFGFNLGIELAQLAIVVCVTLLTVGIKKIGYKAASDRQRVSFMKTAVPAYLIGSLAILWCIERLPNIQSGL